MSRPRWASLGVSRRHVVVGLVVGVPASAFFLYLAARGLEPGKLWDAITGADVGRLLLAVLAMATVAALQAERWRRISRHEGSAPRRSFLALVVAGVAVNNVVPGRPGELVRAYWLARILRVPVARAVGTVVVDRAADVLVLVAVLGATLPFIDLARWLRNLALAALVLAALVAGALVAARWYAHHSQRGRARAASGAVRRSFLGRQLSGLVRGAARTLGPRDVPLVALLSVLAWSAWAGGAWLVASAVGLGLSPLEVAFITAVMNLGVALPSSPGFIGTYQWLAVAGLGLFDVGRTDAFAFSVLMHAVWFVPTTLAGIALAVWTAAPSTGLAARNAA